MILEFKKVSGKSKKFHLDQVSFALESGYMMGLAGKNGAGKTTLIHYILNPKYEFKGTILVDGKDVKAYREEVLDQIGFISEENTFFKQANIRDNGKLLGEFYSKWDEEKYEQYIGQMKLSMGDRLSALSRGEYMKFQLAFAMAHQPKLYLIDEATAGMDPIFRKEFFRYLRRAIINEEASVLLITHIEEDLEEKMDYIGIMEQGKLISYKTTL